MKSHFQKFLLRHQVLQYHCNFLQKLLEAFLLFILIQTYPKNLHLKMFFGAIFHQSLFQNTATLPFAQFERDLRNIAKYNPFTNFLNIVQNNPTVTNQSNRSKDLTFMLNTITATVLPLPRHFLALLNFDDTYSLSSNNKNLFQTNNI